MNGLFEKSDSLNTPIECFIYNAERVEFPVYAVLKFDMNRFNLSPAYAPKLKSIFQYAEKTGMKILFDSKVVEKTGCGNIWAACTSVSTDYQYGRDLVLQSHIYVLLMNSIRFWLADGMTIDSRIIPQTEEEDYVIKNITEYIDPFLFDNLRVTDIADKCGLSYSCFAKKFREHYGMSCKQYIERMRLYKAEEFLMFTDFDLNYISQETGFSDCSHLIKSFKKYKGVTPKKFRADRTPPNRNKS